MTCYCAQLGKIADAEKWFKQAMALNEAEAERIAIDDPDLVPLWDSMRGTKWQRTK